MYSTYIQMLYILQSKNTISHNAHILTNKIICKITSFCLSTRSGGGSGSPRLNFL